jgi:hypothetical protein
MTKDYAILFQSKHKMLIWVFIFHRPIPNLRTTLRSRMADMSLHDYGKEVTGMN